MCYFVENVPGTGVAQPQIFIYRLLWYAYSLQRMVDMNYLVDGHTLSNVELKALMVSRGIKVSNRVYQQYSTTSRLSKNPLECNSILLPDNTVVQMTDMSFHMEYIRLTMNWDTLKQVKYAKDLRTPFSIDLDKNDQPMLYHTGNPVTPISFPPPTQFYRQKTSNGVPFFGNAVLQGLDWISFQMLWECDCAITGQPCQYCYSGGELERLVKKRKPLPKYPKPDDVAQMVEYAINHDGVTSIQITGGTLFNSAQEVDRITSILEAINHRVGMDRIPGEILVFVSPTIDKAGIDRIYEAKADRVSMSLEIWDIDLAKRIMPGKMTHVDRQSHVEILKQIAKERGRGKICSNFIIGLEPPESVLAGAEYLGTHGIVPIASVWIPFGRPVENSMKAPDLPYYREVIAGFDRIYRTQEITPPGARGLNVCMCRDIYLAGCC